MSNLLIPTPQDQFYCHHIYIFYFSSFSLPSLSLFPNFTIMYKIIEDYELLDALHDLFRLIFLNDFWGLINLDVLEVVLSICVFLVCLEEDCLKHWGCRNILQFVNFILTRFTYISFSFRLLCIFTLILVEYIDTLLSHSAICLFRSLNMKIKPRIKRIVQLCFHAHLFASEYIYIVHVFVFISCTWIMFPVHYTLCCPMTTR